MFEKVGSFLKGMAVHIWMVLFLLASLYSQENIGGLGVYLPFNVLIWYVMVLFISFTLFRAFTIHKVVLNPLIYGMGLLLITIVGFGLVKSNYELAVETLTAFVVIILFLFSLSQYEFNDKMFLVALYTLCIAALFQSLIAIVQIFDTSNSLYFLTGYMPFKLHGRPQGVFQQVNMLATFLSMAVVVNLYLVSVKQNEISNRIKFFFLYLSLFLAVLVILQSGSRAGLLATIISVSLVIFIRKKELLNNKWYFWYWIFFVVLSVCVHFLVFDGVQVLGRVAEKFQYLIEGGDARLFLLISSWNMFLESPWLGYGIGNFTFSFQESVQHTGLPVEYSMFNYRAVLHPHNELVFWILQSGIVSLISVVVFIIWYWCYFIKKDIQHSLVLLSMVLPVLIQSQLSFPFMLSAVHLVLLIFILYLVACRHGKVKSFYIDIGTIRLFQFCVLVGVFGLSSLAWNSVKSIEEAYYFQNRMFLYSHQNYKKFEESSYFDVATDNPYFNKIAIEAMNDLAVRALNNNNHYDFIKFIQWADKHNALQFGPKTVFNLILINIKINRIDRVQDLYKYALEHHSDIDGFKVIKTAVENL